MDVLQDISKILQEINDLKVAEQALALRVQNIQVHAKLLDEILSENARLSSEISSTKSKFRTLQKISDDDGNKRKNTPRPSNWRFGTPGERKRALLVSSPSRRANHEQTVPHSPVPYHEFGNDNGLIEHIFAYQSVLPDGTRRPHTRQQLEQHNFETIFRVFLQKALLVSVPDYGPMLNWRILPINPALIASLTGPEDSSADDCSYGTIASGKAVSLYPLCNGRPYREGDPICDRFQLRLYHNAAIICLTDGCNWGDKPRRAARRANNSMTEYVQSHFPQIRTLEDAMQTLLAAMANAQLAIIEGPEEKWMGGKTTANLGLLLEVDQAFLDSQIINEAQDVVYEEADKAIIPTRWVFICVNLGDCKVLHFSCHEGRVHDVTHVMRSDMLDLTDPGGRLGPYSGIWPDLRNLSVFWLPVEEGDLVATVSDGVHDNLDPQIQGLAPSEFGLEAEDWDSLEVSWMNLIKRSYLSHFTEYLLNCQKGVPLEPRNVKNTLVDFCLDNTARSRDYLADHPSNRAPGSYKEYPGKLDHCSIACFRVGEMANRDIPPQPQSSQVFIRRVSETQPVPSVESIHTNEERTLEHVINAVKQDLTDFQERMRQSENENQSSLDYLDYPDPAPGFDDISIVSQRLKKRTKHASRYRSSDLSQRLRGWASSRKPFTEDVL